jgi:hypothetical protein
MIARNRIRSPRRGRSMAEVLVALFLLALGTIAILTMFPLGMYHMGQALKDDRTSQAANQADAFMRMYWRTYVVENTQNRSNTVATGPGGYEPMFPAFDYPDSKPDLNPGVPFPVARRDLPAGTLPSVQNQATHSYPVFVDPIGWHAPWATLNANTYSLQYWVGGQFYPRRSLNLLLNAPTNQSQRTCSMLDGYGYDEGGVPVSVTGAAGGQFERDLRYNWMWILQRPDNTDVNTAKMTVVVFDKRAFQFAPANAEQVFASGAQPAQQIPMVPGSTVIQIPTTQGIPPVQKGGWIMDATPGLRHAQFYRVVSVTDNPTNQWNIPNAGVVTVPTTDLEIQTPVRRLDGSTGGYSGTLIYFAGVSEVFERPNLRANEY